MKKILIYITNLGLGGAERVASNLANYLIHNEYEVVILNERKRTKEYELDCNIKRIMLPLREEKGRIANMVDRILDIRKVFKAERPDLVLAFAGKCNIRSILAKTGLHIPLIVSVRSDPHREYAGKIKGSIARFLFRFADYAVFQTEDAKKFFSKKTQKKSVILLNPLNDKFMRERYEGIRKNEIVSVGSLRPVKNQELLIKAFAKIHNIYPEMILTIYGEGELREKLESLAKELGISQKVFMPGNSDTIYEDIYKSRIFVLPSNSEGMPNALMEAMSLGLACISTDCPCGGPRTLIQDGENGLLVPVGDVEMMAKALEKVLSDTNFEETLGKNAEKIQKICDSKTVLGMWRSIIEMFL